MMTLRQRMDGMGIRRILVMRILHILCLLILSGCILQKLIMVSLLLTLHDTIGKAKSTSYQFVMLI